MKEKYPFCLFLARIIRLSNGSVICVDLQVETSRQWPKYRESSRRSAEHPTEKQHSRGRCGGLKKGVLN